ncbi:MAG: hypothetical protein ACI35O_01245 [Bacillaceae bacterium]
MDKHLELYELKTKQCGCVEAYQKVKEDYTFVCYDYVCTKHLHSPVVEKQEQQL